MRYQKFKFTQGFAVHEAWGKPINTERQAGFRNIQPYKNDQTLKVYVCVF